MTHEGRTRRSRLAFSGLACRGAAAIALLVIACVVSGCIRSGPPAPVDDRTGAYTRTARPPAARPSNTASAPRNSTSAPIASDPISSAPMSSGPISSAPLDAPQPSYVAPVAASPAYVAPTGPATGPAEVTVQVAPGQTLYAIAREHNVPVRALIDLNELDPPYALRAGQRVKVPMLPTYLVADGDTLNTVARRHGVGVRALAETNHLEPPYRIIPGTRLLIPRAVSEQALASMESNPDHVLRLPPGYDAGSMPNSDQVLRVPPGYDAAARAPTREQESRPPIADTPSATPPPLTEPEMTIGSLPPQPTPAPSRNLPTSRGFLWPVHGPIVSPFGPKAGGTQNDGVNIVAKRGTSVHAAEDGVVVYAGNELRGYGNLLLVRHAGGWMTAYAHNDELLVGRGAHVKRGQVISKVGGTGGVASPQLHFELRQSGRPVDPIAVMGPLS